MNEWMKKIGIKTNDVKLKSFNIVRKILKNMTTDYIKHKPEWKE